jgi:hypothetical protein
MPDSGPCCHPCRQRATPGVATQSFEKRLYLPGAGKTGLVEHIKVPGVRVSCTLLDASARQKALQGVGLNSGVAELAGGSTCGSEALDGVSVPLRALTDGLKGRGPCRCPPPLQPMYPVVRGGRFLNGFLLCRIPCLRTGLTL